MFLQLSFALLAAVVIGCGGGGGGGTEAPTQALPQQTLTVQYDHNNDDVADWVTVDTSTSPFRVLEVLEGTADGDPVDMTGLFAGQEIDASLSAALAGQLANAAGVAGRTEIEVQDETGRPVRMVLFR